MFSSVKFTTTYKKCTSLAFPPVLAEWNLKKCDSLAFPFVFAHYTLFELQFADIKETRAMGPAVKIIVWDFVFSALGGQRLFWEFRNYPKISKITKVSHSRLFLLSKSIEKYYSLTFPLSLAVYSCEKIQQSHIPARFAA